MRLIPTFGFGKFLPQLDIQAKVTLSIIVSFASGIILSLSLINLAGVVGGFISVFVINLLGKAGYFLPLVFFYFGWVMFKLQKNSELINDVNSRLFWGMFFMLVSFTAFLNIFWRVESMHEISKGGGLVGYIFYPFLLGRFRAIAAGVILFSLGFFGFFLVSQLSFVEFVEITKESLKDPSKFWSLIPDIFETWKKGGKPTIINDNPKDKKEEDKPKSLNPRKRKQLLNPKLTEVANETLRQRLIEEIEEQKITDEELKEKLKAEADWQLPSFDMLKDNNTKSEPGNIEANKKIIQDTLSNFNISVSMFDVVTGPTVSQYTLKPASGVKLSTIDSLQRDLALALAATSIRLEAPIPGKSLVGIEIPNKIKSQVRLKEILQTRKFINYDKPLPVAIGVDVAGKGIISSISKMPHLLVAGATGSGKSVWINSMLLSLLYRYSPYDLQLILVDMKRVELKLYEHIPHLLAPVITDSEKAINALKWAVVEMDRRYKLLEDLGKRNIVDYNEFVTTSKLEEIKDKLELSYIVFVIDELGDLMMLAKNEVEPIIVRLTQMSRAVGIHLVLGTQRPDTNVVTGLIKANVPSRIAFTVASQVDSRVILDQAGAEKLLGQGDGLYMNQESIKPVRFQGCFVEELEARKVTNFWKEQAQNSDYPANLNESVTQPPKTKIVVPGITPRKEAEDPEELYQNIKEYIITQQSASTSMLQTAFGIGYPKARKMIELLEQDGVVGPSNGSKPRDVYVENYREE